MGLVDLTFPFCLSLLPSAAYWVCPQLGPSWSQSGCRIFRYYILIQRPRTGRAISPYLSILGRRVHSSWFPADTTSSLLKWPESCLIGMWKVNIDKRENELSSQELKRAGSLAAPHLNRVRDLLFNSVGEGGAEPGLGVGKVEPVHQENWPPRG